MESNQYLQSIAPMAKLSVFVMRVAKIASGNGWDVFNRRTKMKLKKTTDYSQFKILESNRPVGNLEKLSKSISEVGQICPIVCNERMEVIDGQHRLKDAEAHGRPIWYVINPNIVERSLIEANSTQKKWTLKDYAEYHAKKGDENYKKLLYYVENEGLMVDTAFCLNYKVAIRGREREQFRNGEFSFDAPVFLKNLYNLNKFSFFSKYKTSAFVQSAIKLFNHSDFDEERLDQKLQVCAGDITPCSGRVGYMAQIERLYNYGQKKGRINLIDQA